MNKYILILITILNSACMATGPIFTPQQLSDGGNALIYVYRPSRFTNAAGAPEITVDGVRKGSLKNGGYLAIEVKPGEHSVVQVYSYITWALKAEPILIKAEPKKEYFIILDINGSVESLGATPSGGIYMINKSAYFHEVEVSVGLSGIRELKQSN